MPTPGSAHTYGPGLAQLDADIGGGITLSDDNIKKTTYSPPNWLPASVCQYWVPVNPSTMPPDRAAAAGRRHSQVARSRRPGSVRK